METTHGGDYYHGPQKPASALACPICERAILPNTKFCDHCRAAILRRYCPGCNKLVPDATEICPYCGASATATPRIKRFNPLLVLSSAAFLVCILMLIVGIRNNSPVPAKNTGASPAEAQQATEPPATPKFIANEQVKPATISDEISAISQGEQLNYQGYQLINRREFADAIVVLRKATAILKGTGAPAYGYALFNLGQALRLSGNAKEAVPVLEESLKNIPQRELAEHELSKARQLAFVQR